VVELVDMCVQQYQYLVDKPFKLRQLVVVEVLVNHLLLV
jgi:hypothetical protein